jgi:DNA-directed RNA polymerase subunit RPC12/RpoP
MLAVPILAIVGTMLCLTGLGAILGVPMIAAAILAPLLGPMIGIGVLHGACPWCGTRIHSIITVPRFYCHACSKRIAIEKRKFLRVE